MKQSCCGDPKIGPIHQQSHFSGVPVKRKKIYEDICKETCIRSLKGVEKRTHLVKVPVIWDPSFREHIVLAFQVLNGSLNIQ